MDRDWLESKRNFLESIDSSLNSSLPDIAILKEKDAELPTLPSTIPIYRQGNAKGPKIWAVASGKGGVGKTFISSSIAIQLAKMGHKVILCDLDISGANAHTLLGMNPKDFGIRNWLEGSKKLSECISKTEIENLSFIQGLWDTWIPIELSAAQTLRLNYDLRALDADYVIIDLGAGAFDSNMAFFAHADRPILIADSNPSTIEKTYRFIESYICYQMKAVMSSDDYSKMIERFKLLRSRSLPPNISFINILSEFDAKVLAQYKQMQLNPIRLINNCARLLSDMSLGVSVRSVCLKYFDLSLEATGNISFDNAVWQSAETREPVLLSQPFSLVSGQITGICKHLIDPVELSAVA